MLIKTGTTNRYLLLLVLLSLSFSNVQAGNEAELPRKCQIDCVSPYGRILGTSNRGVQAYSNCHSSCVISDANHWKGTYTGVKWQCVEYVRRWLLINKGAIYDDVDTAADIWNNINHLTDIETGRSIPLESHLNGSRLPPRVGDLLVYTKEFNGTGHVAVVIDTDYGAGVIEVGEQNYNNEPWPGDFSRKIGLVKKDGNYWLLDAYLLGWKHAGN